MSHITVFCPQLVETEDEPLVTLVDRGHVHETMVRARKILWDVPEGSCKLDKFMETYKECYNAPPNLEIMKQDLEDIFSVSTYIQLPSSITPL